MAKRSYLLKIEKPCMQDWHAMSINESGRFCTHCSKTVIDLTRLSDTEILQIIKNASGGICGRLTKDQPERKIVLRPQSGIRSWYSKLIAACLLLLASKKSTATVHQPQQEVIKLVGTGHKREKTQETKYLNDTVTRRICGKIIAAEDKEPLIGAIIKIKHTEISTLAKEDGTFEFFVPDSLLPKKIILIVSFIGYQTKEFAVKRKDIEKEKYLVIKPEISISGDVQIIAGAVDIY